MLLRKFLHDIVVRVIRLENVFIKFLAVVGMIRFYKFDLLEFVFLEVEARVEIVIVEMEYFFKCLKRKVILRSSFGDSIHDYCILFPEVMILPVEGI